MLSKSGSRQRPDTPIHVTFSNKKFWVELDDGRTIGVPLAWYPRLSKATPEQLIEYELSFYGIHWEKLDEDISIEGILAGRHDQTRRQKHHSSF